MKKILPLVFLILFPVFLYPQKNKNFENNVFPCLIKNVSDYEIELDGVKVKSGSSEIHNFPLHSSPLYDGWTLTYFIPLLNGLNYSIEEKKYLADNQELLLIENPSESSEALNVQECYVVLKNQSTSMVQLVNPKKNTIYPVFQEGEINHRTQNLSEFVVYSISGLDSAVLNLQKNDEISLSDENTRKKITINAKYVPGYVYVFSYTENALTLLDFRPIKNFLEKSWKKEFEENIVLRDIETTNSKIYLLGTETLSDSKNRSYISAFLQCFDRNGKELWHKTFGKKGTDSYLYDMTFNENGNLVVVGQILGEDLSAILLEYDSLGNLQNSFETEKLVGLESICKYNKNLLATGYDFNGEQKKILINSNLTFSDASEQSFEGFSDFTAKNLIQSVSGIVKDNNGNTFAAGESANMEKPVATVVKKSKDGGISVFYTANENFSFVSDIKINTEANQIVICGSLNGKDSFGHGGMPFVRCIDLLNGKVLWENILEKSNFDMALKIKSMEDYGFVILLASCDKNGNVSSPCSLVRTNAVGKF